ncbi:MAG: hypothetical protein LC808_21855 [Actinobacteria bacterium]|nr:hypothetical protein [Actinomycetota bacterium]
MERSWWWLPVSGHRHAFRLRDRDIGFGEKLTSLCSVDFVRPNPPSNTQWLWSTCDTCWLEACILAGLRVRENKKPSTGRKTG